jgi:hypothetical protein
MIFTGTTIDELMGIVQKVEARTASTAMERDLLKYSSPAFNVYGIEQFQKFEREMALMGVA